MGEPLKAVLERLRRVAAGSSAPWGCGVLALLLSLPSMAIGLIFDDYVLAQRVAEGTAWWDLFAFIEPPDVAAAMERGYVGWWAYPDLQLSFFRPISSLMHTVEFTGWPSAPWLMHLWSALLYAGVVVVVGCLYRRWLGPAPVAGLAVLLFGIDEAHAQTVGWLATRNTLLATGLGFGALWAHDRWRREGWRPGAGLGPLFLVVALLSAEAGLTVGGYLFAHALYLDRGPWRRRMLALWPYAAIVIGWRVAYVWAGFGVVGSGMYRDIGADPLGFIIEMGRAACVLSFAQLTVPGVSLLGLSRSGWWICAAGLAAILWFLWPLLRRHKEARFFALGMVLSSAPFAATLPTDRLLLPLSLGGAGLVAMVLTAARANPVVERRTRPFAGVMLVLHLVLAPLLFIPSLLTLRSFQAVPDQLADAIPDRQRVVIVNVPLDILLVWQQAIHERRGEPWPEHVYPLHAGQTTLTLERTGPASLELSSRAGWMPSRLNRFARAEHLPMSVGEQVVLEGMTIEVLASNGAGRPVRVAARFDRVLEALGWVAWVDEHPVEWQPPHMGETVTVEARAKW